MNLKKIVLPVACIAFLFSSSVCRAMSDEEFDKEYFNTSVWKQIRNDLRGKQRDIPKVSFKQAAHCFMKYSSLAVPLVASVLLDQENPLSDSSKKVIEVFLGGLFGMSLTSFWSPCDKKIMLVEAAMGLGIFVDSLPFKDKEGFFVSAALLSHSASSFINSESECDQMKIAIDVDPKFSESMAKKPKKSECV